MPISLSMSAKHAIADWFAADQGAVAVEDHKSRLVRNLVLEPELAWRIRLLSAVRPSAHTFRLAAYRRCRSAGLEMTSLCGEPLRTTSNPNAASAARKLVIKCERRISVIASVNGCALEDSDARNAPAYSRSATPAP